MRRSLPFALAAAAALAAGGCSTSPCQVLGERLCSCTGFASDVCTTQVGDQLGSLHPTRDQIDTCLTYLNSCAEPPNTVFCEWLNTSDGMAKCGLVPPPDLATSTAGP